MDDDNEVIIKEVYSFGEIIEKYNEEDLNCEYLIINNNIIKYYPNINKFVLYTTVDNIILYKDISYKINNIVIIIITENKELTITQPLINFYNKFIINVDNNSKIFTDYNNDYLIVSYNDNSKLYFKIFELYSENKLMHDYIDNIADNNNTVINVFLLENNNILLCHKNKLILYEMGNSHITKINTIFIDIKDVKINYDKYQICVLDTQNNLVFINFTGKTIYKEAVTAYNIYFNINGIIKLLDNSILEINNTQIDINSIIESKIFPKIYGNIIKKYNYNYKTNNTIIDIIPNITVILDANNKLLSMMISHYASIIKTKLLLNNIYLLLDSDGNIFIYNNNILVKEILMNVILDSLSLPYSIIITDLTIDIKKKELCVSFNNGNILLLNIKNNKIKEYKNITNYCILKLEYNKSYEYIITLDSDGISVLNATTFLKLGYFNVRFDGNYNIINLKRRFYISTNIYNRSKFSVAHNILPDNDFLILTAKDNRTIALLNFYNDISNDTHSASKNCIKILQNFTVSNDIIYYELKDEVPYVIIIDNLYTGNIFYLLNFKLIKKINLNNISPNSITIDSWFLYLFNYNNNSKLIEIFWTANGDKLEYNFIGIYNSVKKMLLNNDSSVLMIVDGNAVRFVIINKTSLNAYNNINTDTSNNINIWNNFQIE